jgi:hypothetical protein
MWTIVIVTHVTLPFSMTVKVLASSVMLLDFVINAVLMENVSSALKDIDWILKKTSVSPASILKAAKLVMNLLAPAANRALH